MTTRQIAHINGTTFIVVTRPDGTVTFSRKGR